MKSGKQPNELIRIDNQRELYHPPQMEIFEVKVEKGFAASSGDGTAIDPWGTGGSW